MSPLNKHALHHTSALSRPTLCTPGPHALGQVLSQVQTQPALAMRPRRACSRPGGLRGGVQAATAELGESWPILSPQSAEARCEPR